MKTAAKWALTMLLQASMAAAQDARPPYWSDAWRGWHFYEPADDDDASERAQRRRPSPPPARNVQKPIQPPELAAFEQLQLELEVARKVAVITSSETNVRRYMELEAAVVARASKFADVAQRVAWSDPQLDPSLQGRPVNTRALEVFEQKRLTDSSRAIGELGRDHVLLFFFRSDCPYCHAFAPILLAVQARHGIRIEAVSMDGGSIPGFHQARMDNGISNALRVGQVPAVYLAQPSTGTITPIGFGVLSQAQLVERIVAVSAPTHQAMVPSAVTQVGRRVPSTGASGLALSREVQP